ncbi:unnamed protein product [Notodromas monacha]|uniref:Uncharacterized protein n=1 Tax=Notodromas monacha TaxID=399045 RepID=A0A7R9G995_9CRUS|nr:unnamed protein product [Notodromas monacha]CAG0912619.1 unnamed protein product [Notodromas monacha]
MNLTAHRCSSERPSESKSGKMSGRKIVTSCLLIVLFSTKYSQSPLFSMEWLRSGAITKMPHCPTRGSL